MAVVKASDSDKDTVTAGLKKGRAKVQHTSGDPPGSSPIDLQTTSKVSCLRQCWAIIKVPARMTAMVVLLIVAVACLAYANGANDNFKGVATLFGSGTSTYSRALTWATGTTFLGSVMAVFFAQALLKNFRGKGLIDNQLTFDPSYTAAVALGAGLTVLLATFVGAPVSTTHSLIGALLGAGWAAGSTIHLGRLCLIFFLPLLVSPLLAILLTVLSYPLLKRVRMRLGVTEKTCVCLDQKPLQVVSDSSYIVALKQTQQPALRFDQVDSCRKNYQGHVPGIDAPMGLSAAHYLSAGIVGFARGMNDTPKIAALLLAATSLDPFAALVLIGVVIAIGALISAGRVAETMSHRITSMNHGQGFTANLITGLIVIVASRFGLPVSTTHVSCGSLFGLGAVTRQGKPNVIAAIVGAWCITLPLGAGLGMLGWYVFSTG